MRAHTPRPSSYSRRQEWIASAPGVGSIRASVPGDLITDLEAAGLIGDPLYELNWQNASLWDSHVWTYATTFTLTPAAAASTLLLVLDGVKMSAHVSLNGVAVGHTTDQYLRYTFPVAGVAVAGPNTLTVSFDSADQSTEGRWMACTGGWVRAGAGAGVG